MDPERFEENIIEKIKITVASLQEEWQQMSLAEDQIFKRRQVVFNALSDFCCNILDNERIIKERIIKRIELSQVEINRLSKELGIAHEDPPDLVMLELDNYLSKKLSELLSLKENRCSEFDELSKKEELICKYLDEEACCTSQNVVPTEDDLKILKNHIIAMEQEKKIRNETYKTLRKDIARFVEQLERPLEGGLLLDIVCNCEREDSLTKAYLLEFRKVHSDLEFEVKEMESRSLELREKIFSLWNLLKFTPEKKEAFLSSVPLHTLTYIKKLEDHLTELKKLRLQNLGKFIKELKCELEKWWERCFVGERRKSEFVYRNSDEVSEKILEAYEVQVKKWKDHYTNYACIFEKVEHFLDLFDTMQQLEEKAKDPSRLFNTRGGSLLQEEKERNRVKQELPLVQEHLINLCQEYDDKNDNPFLIDGSTIQDYLSKLWDYHQVLKEKEKLNRINKNKMATPKCVKGSAKKTPCVATPVSSRKREREGDDLDCKSANKMAKSSIAISLYRSPYKKQRTPGLALLQRNKPLNEKNNLPPLPLKRLSSSEDNILQASMTYDNFKEALQNRNENINSTTLSFASLENEDS